MRNLFIVLLLSLSSLSFADSIRCYAPNGPKVYDRKVTEITFDDEKNMFVFIEKNTGRLVFTSLSCIGKMDPPL